MRVLELLWSMIMAPDAHADVVAAASKGLRGALQSYDDSLEMAQVRKGLGSRVKGEGKHGTWANPDLRNTAQKLRPLTPLSATTAHDQVYEGTLP